MRIPRIRIRSATGKKSYVSRTLARRFKKAYIAYMRKKQLQGQLPGFQGGAGGQGGRGGPGGPGGSGGQGQTFYYQPMIYAPYNKRGGVYAPYSRRDDGRDVYKIGELDIQIEDDRRNKEKEEDVKKDEKKEIRDVQIERDGVTIPTEYRKLGAAISLESNREALQQVSITYHLIPRFPKKGDLIFSYATIKWDPSIGELVYSVIEPKLTQRDRDIIEYVKRELEEKLDVDFGKLGEVKAKNLLQEETMRILNTVPDMMADEMKKQILFYFIQKEIMGLGKIETLMNDPNIEDVSCDGIGIPLYIYHRDPQIGSLKTNIFFNDTEELNGFVFRLAQKCKKMISIAEPLLDGALPDGSRIQATLGTDIAMKGSNFTIRKFTEDPLTPSHMLKKGTLNSTQLAYLWLAIDNGQSVLISGGTATGKTSLLNALSLFIRPNLKIVSIEDTAELRLPHPHWIPEVARSALSTEGKSRKGEVSLFDLLRSSLRQRPDYIIMGEVRGKEAFVLFQQMATGHPYIATIHAASIEQLIDRLTTPPISLPPSLIENINVVVFLTLSRLKESYVRRTDAILEVTGVKDNKPVTNKVFEWMPMKDTFEIVNKSFVLKTLARRMGITEEAIGDELMRRKMIIEWMMGQEIFDYREVAKIVSEYYSNPDKVMGMVEMAQ